MASPHLTIVITTIHVPTVLEGYCSNIERYEHLCDVSAIVVGDLKTPHEAVEALAARLRQRGFDVLHLDMEAQEEYLELFPRLKPFIPYNSDIRRNIGYLMAAERGADIIVALDDDNYVGEQDWYADHCLVGSRVRLKTVSSSSGWFNPCAMMEMDPPRRIYARGFPYSRRWVPNEETYATTEGRVVLNGGLWLGEPDVDAITRLAEPVRAVRLREERVMLAPGTWAPINTQNTAFHREVLPAFYFVPITGYIGGVIVERFGDIWAGFFARKAIDHMDDRVCYGVPACDHRRNHHNLLKDLELEFWAIQLTEPLWESIAGWTLRARSYVETYLEMADFLERADWSAASLSDEVQAYFGGMARSMRAWIDAVQRIEGF